MNANFLTKKQLTILPSLCLLIGYGLETLWLLCVVMVPLAFVDPGSFRSEAVIAHFEVPKVTLFRTLVSLMAGLWAIELVVNNRVQYYVLNVYRLILLDSRFTLRSIIRGISDIPTRWVVTAVVSFFLAVGFSTLFSASIIVSFWGEVPAQDGYTAYTLICYLVLFGIISSHVKTGMQLWRLVGAVAFVGFLVSGYGVFQHYHIDFLGITEFSGGGTNRITSFMGNAIFCAAFLLMTTIVTAALGFINLFNFKIYPYNYLNQYLKLGLILSVWGISLAVQLVAMAFTYSRGPWVGLIVGLLVFYGLGLTVVGWRVVLRCSVVLAVACALAVSFLFWKGSIGLFGIPTWAGLLSCVFILVFSPVAIIFWNKFRWIYLAAGLVMAAIVIIFMAGSLANIGTAFPVDSVHQSESIPFDVGSRLASIKDDVITGGLSGRGTHWAISWDLILTRPWAEFDTLNFKALRHLIGYGPDLFRYVYLLESPPLTEAYIPFEPDHAHNFFIHQMVELGFIGFFAILATFGTVFVCSWRYLKKDSPIGNFRKVIMLGLLAVIVGRFVEMMFGVARISDLTIFWAVLAIFVVIPHLNLKNIQQSEAKAVPRNNLKYPGDRSSSIWENTPTRPYINFAIKISGMLIIIVMVGFLAWFQNINYLRAGFKAEDAIQYYKAGNLSGTVDNLIRATQLGPGVFLYHNYLAGAYAVAESQVHTAKVSGCIQQEDILYSTCLAVKGYQYNVNAVEQRPLYYQNHLVLGKFLASHTDYDGAARSYERSLQMIPNSWHIRNELADVYLKAGRSSDAVRVLDESLGITGATVNSTSTLLLRGQAYQQLGNFEQAARSFENTFELGSSGAEADSAFELLSGAYRELGFGRAESGYRFISENPPANYMLARIELGNFYRSMDRPDKALMVFIDLLEKTSLSRKPTVLVIIGDIYQAMGDTEYAQEYYSRALEIDHEHSIAWNKFTENLLSLEIPDITESTLKQATVDLKMLGGKPSLAAGYLESQFYKRTGQLEEASVKFEELIRKINEVNRSDLLVELGDIYQELGRISEASDRYELAFVSEPGNGEAWLAYGTTELYLGHHERAREALVKASELGLGIEAESVMIRLVQLKEAETHHIHQVASGYRESGELEQAAEYLEEVLVSEESLSTPAKEDGFDLLAEIYGSLGFDRAMEGYDRIIKGRPITTLTADHLLHLNANREVIESAQANSATPGSALWYAWTGKGKFLNIIDRNEDSLYILTQLLLSAEFLFGVEVNRSDLLVELGDIYQELGRISEASERYELVLVSEPGNGEAWLAYGTTELYLGHHERAGEALIKASGLGLGIEAEPVMIRLVQLKEAETHHIHQVASGYRESGELEQAAEYLEEVLVSEESLSTPAKEDGFDLLAEIYGSLGFDRAMEGYDRIIKGRPITTLTADHLLHLNANREVIESAQANSATPGSVLWYAWTSKGKFLNIIDRNEDSLYILTQLLLSTEFLFGNWEEQIPILINLGDLYTDQGLLVKASDSYGKALVIDPTNLQVQAKFATVQNELGNQN